MRSRGDVRVLKIGGSILKGRNAYRRAAWFLEDRLKESGEKRCVVVVSAEHGATDALERTAKRILPAPSGRSLDLLWSLGELRSVALVAMNLEKRGIRAVGLNVHEAGLRAERGSGSPVSLELTVLEQELVGRRVVVVPGFLATSRTGQIVSLGRGGSDLTAVLLAIHLGAAECELVKNVGGYFSSDPALDGRADPITWLSYNRAIEMAADGSAIVQREALEAAERANLPIRVRGVRRDGHETIVGRVAEASSVLLSRSVGLVAQDTEREGRCEDKSV